MAKRSSILAAVAAFVLAASLAAACSSSRSGSRADQLTFTSAIQPLLEAKCQACHREGGIAPFSLVTYDEVRAIGEAVKAKIVSREMPPWGAFDDPACTVSNKFKDDLRLTDEEIDTFTRWVERGTPLGDTSKQMTAPIAAVTGLSDRTHAYELATSHVVEPGTADELRCFPIDPGFAEDTWVGASIVVPGDPKVVHHALVYLDPEHEGMARARGAEGYPCFGGSGLKSSLLLLAWSPGGTPTTYGQNAGLTVPKGTHFVMQVHYHPLSVAATGRMSLELKTLPYRPENLAEFVLVGNADRGTTNPTLLPGAADPAAGPTFVIPSNAKDHVEAMEFVVPDAVRPTSLNGVGAHMHWAGVGMRLEVERKAPAPPEPAKECLLNVAKYDFSWQRTYAYDAPPDRMPILRAGDKLRIACTYDNTSDNRYIARLMREQRMSKPPEIRLGAEALDEMCQAILVLVTPAPAKP